MKPKMKKRMTAPADRSDLMTVAGRKVHHSGELSAALDASSRTDLRSVTAAELRACSVPVPDDIRDDAYVTLLDDEWSHEP